MALKLVMKMPEQYSTFTKSKNKKYNIRSLISIFHFEWQLKIQLKENHNQSHLV
jgi:hypothetical protein